MNINELSKILENHKLWLKDRKKGERADLRGVDLSEADLSGADLSGVDLERIQKIAKVRYLIEKGAK